MANTTIPIAGNPAGDAAGNAPDLGHVPAAKLDAPGAIGDRLSALLARLRATERQPLIAVGVGIILGYVLARLLERMRHV